MRTVPIAAADFDERWQLPITQAPIELPVQTSSKTFHQVSRSMKHRDKVCGNRDRRYSPGGRRLSWRCRQ